MDCARVLRPRVCKPNVQFNPTCSHRPVRRTRALSWSVDRTGTRNPTKFSITRPLQAKPRGCGTAAPRAYPPTPARGRDRAVCVAHTAAKALLFQLCAGIYCQSFFLNFINHFKNFINHFKQNNAKQKVDVFESNMVGCECRGAELREGNPAPQIN